MSRANPNAGVPVTAVRLADHLADALRMIGRAPPAGARGLAALHGITIDGAFTGPYEAVLFAFIAALTTPDTPPRAFIYGTSLVVEMTSDGLEPALIPVRTGSKVERAAAGCLANLVLCEADARAGEVVAFTLPAKALAALLNAEPLTRALPRIRLHARRPVYAPDFTLLGPGYHREHEVLVHGPAIDPDLTPLPTDPAAVDRLPTHLRVLLRGFCFQGEADLANCLGLLLTGLLIQHFAIPSKAVALVDGNQPGVGKTLLLRIIGLILDGVDPHLIHYTSNEEELQKRICATLRPGRQSVLVIDNAKEATGTPISSPTIEANSMAPEIALRLLGKSENFVRPNDVIWSLSMNQTRVSPDLMSRGLPVRLEFQGSPENRTFAAPDPVEYARTHRLDILGELAGFVERWNLAGRPEGTRSHRCHHWARVIGGILSANGFPEFLANYQDAAHSFNAELEELTTLFDLVLARPDGPYRIVSTTEENP